MIDLIQRAAELLAHARHAIALTGAGISTPSGIPDFRTKGSGLWSNYDPMKVATVYAFRQRPQEFYAWIRPLVQAMRAARPNAAHLALAELEAAGIIKTLITQNIDGLHQRAGSRAVIELHGDTRTTACIRCYAVYATGGFGEEAIDRGEIPHCPACGGILKPNVILYGEDLPVQALMAAKRAALACDLMLVTGSSLEVAPASDLPIMAIQRQVALVLINQSQTYLDQQSEVVLHADVAEALPQIAALCRNYT